MIEVLARSLSLGPEHETLWKDADSSLICLQRRQITHDVVTFVLAASQPRRFHFEPGQFITITVDVDGKRIDRCYTISSPPTRPFTVAITVKRVPGGIVSNWLHDNMYAGGMLEAKGPFGLFSYVHHPADRYLFLSAGSGITPLMSMLRSLHDFGSPTDVVFVHSARTPADIIFRTELNDVAAASDAARVTHICEADAPTEAWPGYRGRLTIAALQHICPDFLDREVFVCGPAPYMQAAQTMLTGAGLDPQRYHQESFDLARPDPPASAAGGAGGIPPAQQGSHLVEFVKSARSVICPEGTSVLDAAGTVGLALASSCGQGLCGTCKVTLLAGDVDMNHNGGIRPREVAQGKILLCCSTPLSPLIIDA